MQSKWVLRLVTSALWALAAASAVAWGLRLAGQSAPSGGAVPAAAQRANGEPAVSTQALAQWLGATTLVAKENLSMLAPSRFSLSGVVAQGKNGVALLVVDSKPAKPYAVGSRIDDSTVLQSVGPRHAVLAASMDAAAGQRLELPANTALKSATAPNLPMSIPIPAVAPAVATPPQPGGALLNSSRTGDTQDSTSRPRRGSPERP